MPQFFGGKPPVGIVFDSDMSAMDDALASFAMAYAKRTNRDYDRLKQAKGKLLKSEKSKQRTTDRVREAR